MCMYMALHRPCGPGVWPKLRDWSRSEGWDHQSVSGFAQESLWKFLPCTRRSPWSRPGHRSYQCRRERRPPSPGSWRWCRRTSGQSLQACRIPSRGHTPPWSVPEPHSSWRQPVEKFQHGHQSGKREGKDASVADLSLSLPLPPSLSISFSPSSP